MYCIALCCIVVYCIVLYSSELYYIVLHGLYNLLYCIALRCGALNCIASFVFKCIAFSYPCVTVLDKKLSTNISLFLSIRMETNGVVCAILRQLL